LINTPTGLESYVKNKINKEDKKDEVKLDQSPNNSNNSDNLNDLMDSPKLKTNIDPYNSIDSELLIKRSLGKKKTSSSLFVLSRPEIIQSINKEIIKEVSMVNIEFIDTNDTDQISNPYL